MKRLILKDFILENFESIYKQNYKKLFGIVTKIINDKEAACDIVQDVFIIYYQKLQHGHAISNPSSWLLRVTINKCIDYSKQQKKHKNFNESISIISDSDSFEKNEIRNFIKKALSELKPHERALILLYNEGFSYKEIAEIADINFVSVGKTISRTLLKLKNILKTYDHEMLR